MVEAPQARRTRRTRQDMHDVVMAAGRTLLEQEGLAVGLQAWTLFGVRMEALAVRFFEIDPDWAGAPAAV